MSNKETRRNIPKCGCRGCVHLKTNRSGKFNRVELDEAADVNSNTVECTRNCNKLNISKWRSDRGTFIKITGPTSGAHFNPAASVIPSSSNSRTCGCFVEKNTDGKSRAFNLESDNGDVKSPEEYFRSITIWQGFLIKPINVRTRRASSISVEQADLTNNGLLPSDYSLCNGNSRLEEKGSYKNKNSTIYRRPKVGMQICFQNRAPLYFRLKAFSLFCGDSVSRFASWFWKRKIGTVFIFCLLCRFTLKFVNGDWFIENRTSVIFPF